MHTPVLKRLLAEGTPAQKRLVRALARRSDLLRGGVIQKVGEFRGGAGAVYLVPDVRKDRFVHFTTEKRALQIGMTRKLLMNPPYKKFGIDAVAAVSAVWGEPVPGVQTTHYDRTAPGERLVAVLFTTTTPPMYGHREEVIWERDVTLTSVRVVSLQKGMRILQQAPVSIDSDATVYYTQLSKRVRDYLV